MTATRLYVQQNPIREADGWRYAEGRATEIDLETVDEYELRVLDSPEQTARILAIDSQAENLRKQAEERVTTLHALLQQKYPSLKALRDAGWKDNEIVEAMKRLLETTTEIQRGYRSGLYRRIQVLPSGTAVYRVRHEDMPEQSEYTESDPQLWGPSEERQGAGRLRIHGESLLYVSTSWLTAADEAGIGPLQTVQTDRVRGKPGSATAADRPAPFRGTAGGGQRPRAMAQYAQTGERPHSTLPQ